MLINKHKYIKKYIQLWTPLPPNGVHNVSLCRSEMITDEEVSMGYSRHFCVILVIGGTIPLVDIFLMIWILKISKEEHGSS